MQILLGPPPPPPPWDGPCWPTPQAATARTRTVNRVARNALGNHAQRDISTPPSLESRSLFTNISQSSGHILLLPLPEELVEEHGCQEQDAQHEELPGTGHPGQYQAVAQDGDDQDAEHRAAYRPRPAVDARTSQDDGGDHVELQPGAGVAPRRVDPGGV